MPQQEMELHLTLAHQVLLLELLQQVVAVVEVDTVQLIQIQIFIMVLQEVLVAVVVVILEHK